MSEHRFLGAILLIAGTSIGAGTIAVPVITAQYGVTIACLLFILCWFFMTLAALLMLEVNLSLEADTNLVSMAKATLGPIGAIIAWVVYLLLLYALVVAYTEGISDLVVSAGKNLFGITIYWGVGAALLLILLSVTVYLGTRIVDCLNRGLMLGGIATFCILIGILYSHIHPGRWAAIQWRGAWSPLPVLMTTFGYQIIIPSLRTYLHSDTRKLQWAIILGGLIPLIVYSLWELLILGAVPLMGRHGLLAVLASGQIVPRLTTALNTIAGSRWLAASAHLFIFFIIATSLVGVALALFDFLADGLHTIKHRRLGRVITLALTFIPPTFFVFFYPAGFIAMLNYGGILVAVLLVLLPALMALSGRLRAGQLSASSYRAPGGLLSILATTAFAVLVIALASASR